MQINSFRRRCAAAITGLPVATTTIALVALAGCAPAASRNVAEQLPAAADILFWPHEVQAQGYRNLDKIYATRTIPRGASVYPLPDAPAGVAVSYELDGKRWTTDDLMKATHAEGLIVVKNGQVALERYEQGADRHSRWSSFSVTKSITSTLVGAAIKDGYIASVDDPVTRYLPALKGSAYDGATIRNLLNMASGVKWNENYMDAAADVNKVTAIMADRHRPGSILKLMASLPLAAQPGTQFEYSSGESHVLGEIVAAATRRNLADYLAEKIWKPFGMEQDGSWVLESDDGREFGGCCVSMTLRDYARFGLFFLGGGQAGGAQVLPQGWLKEATQPSAPLKGDGYGYGYQWWVFGDGSFRAIGIFGQTIYINPAENLVVAFLSTYPAPMSNEHDMMRGVYLNALVQTLH